MLTFALFHARAPELRWGNSFAYDIALNPEVAAENSVIAEDHEWPKLVKLRPNDEWSHIQWGGSSFCDRSRFANSVSTPIFETSRS